MIDQTSNTIGVPMGADFMQTSWNRTNLTIFPLVLMHIKMEIQNCGVLSGLNFTDISFTPMFSYYTINATDDIIDRLPYDLTNYVGQINDPTCIPIIDNFTNPVSAGTGSILTITGNYFGSTMQANSTVVFRNADQGNVFPLQTGPKKGGVQHYDVIHWSDDTIQIVLPSVIDSVPDTFSNQTYPIPSSGTFKVVNLANNTTLSPFAITIPYGTRQIIATGYKKSAIDLADKNGTGGYTLHCNPAVEANIPGAKAIIRKGMRDWSCVSGINWILGSDLTTGTAGDGVCMINLHPTDTTFAQQTIPQVGMCADTTFYLNSFDIEIVYPLPYSKTWQADSTGNVQSGYVDFYHANAHELGHGHFQIHVNDSLGDLMFYVVPNGPYPQAQRRRVWTSAGSMQGSVWMLTNLITPNCGAPDHVLNFPSSSDCLGIGIEETADGIQINSYPNPASEGYFNVSFTLQSEARTRFLLYNELGQLIRTTSELPNVGNMTETIYIVDLANGTYFLQVLINDAPHTIKVIKN